MRRRECGHVLAWNALFLAFVVVPLLTLLMDGVRLYYLHDRLQAAADAACEDAAVVAVDRAAYRDAGKVTFLPGSVASAAQGTFASVLSTDTALSGVSFGLSVSADYAAGVVNCSGYANVSLLTLPGQEQLTAASSSQIAFHRK